MEKPFSLEILESVWVTGKKGRINEMNEAMVDQQVHEFQPSELKGNSTLTDFRTIFGNGLAKKD